MAVSRKAARDERDFDTTQLHEAGHGQILHRDYSAHFFRWSFARRLIQKTDTVLEVGCGQDKPLSKVLVRNLQPYCAAYVGVDLNKLKESKNERTKFFGEFNFIERWKEVQKLHPEGYDKLVTFEVIEHINSRMHQAFLKACRACLKPGGVLLISTPVYDGRRMAANHIAELTVDELAVSLKKAGFEVEQRFGTFMDIKHIGKAESKVVPKEAIAAVRKGLERYFDNDAISNIFGPLYEDSARNCVWVCRRPA